MYNRTRAVGNEMFVVFTTNLGGKSRRLSTPDLDVVWTFCNTKYMSVERVNELN